jgi:hypothetical protein
LILSGPATWADEPSLDTRRGPTDVRDEHVLAQDRLTLPSLSPDTLEQGQFSLRTSFLWLNTFNWTQDVPGEHPGDRRFLIDGETRTLDLTFRYGLAADLDVAARVPLRWRGGGVLDGLIDTWHNLFSLPNGNRNDFLTDAFRVEGVTTDFHPFSWNDDVGTGLGNVELSARWRFHHAGRDGWSVAAATHVALPTGTFPFDDDAAGVGLQLVAAKRLGRRWDLFLGAGTTLQGDGPVRVVQYETARVHGFTAFEWRPGRRISLVAETDIASRLIANIASYPGMHWMVHGEARIDVTRRVRLELGFTENLKDQQSTADFGMLFGLVWRR